MNTMTCSGNDGAASAVFLKGWLRAALGLCLLGLPVILGYYGYQLADSRASRLAKDEAAQSMAASLAEFVGGLGNLVQPDHGSVADRLHASARPPQVKVGDVVKKGQVIALSRDAAPRGYIEVHKHGRVVDPASYIHSTIR